MARMVIKDSCKRAIEINISSGATVCQTRAARMGDLVYNLIYAADLAAQESDGSHTAGAKAGQATAERIVGKGLIYGVSFAPRGISSAGSEAKLADCRIGAKSRT